MSNPAFHEPFQMMSLSINSLDTGGKMLHFQELKKQFLVYFYYRDDVMLLLAVFPDDLGRFVNVIAPPCGAAKHSFM